MSQLTNLAKQLRSSAVDRRLLLRRGQLTARCLGATRTLTEAAGSSEASQEHGTEQEAAPVSIKFCKTLVLNPAHFVLQAPRSMAIRRFYLSGSPRNLRVRDTPMRCTISRAEGPPASEIASGWHGRRRCSQD